MFAGEEYPAKMTLHEVQPAEPDDCLVGGAAASWGCLLLGFAFGRQWFVARTDRLIYPSKSRGAGDRVLRWCATLLDIASASFFRLEETLVLTISMKFSIRDLMWLTVVVALAVGWCVDRTRLVGVNSQLSSELQDFRNSAEFE